MDETKALEREGWDLDEIAVLYRSNAQSRVIEQSLFRSGIPYKIYGGLRFYERQEIKHALAYLRLAVNPDDDNALCASSTSRRAASAHAPSKTFRRPQTNKASPSGRQPATPAQKPPKSPPSSA